MGRVKEELDRLLEEHKYEMWEALQEIAIGQGRYSRDPLTHASNTIDDMKAEAQKVLDKIQLDRGYKDE